MANTLRKVCATTDPWRVVAQYVGVLVFRCFSCWPSFRHPRASARCPRVPLTCFCFGMQVLDGFHSKKKERGVDDMLTSLFVIYYCSTLRLLRSAPIHYSSQYWPSLCAFVCV